MSTRHLQLALFFLLSSYVIADVDLSTMSSSVGYKLTCGAVTDSNAFYLFDPLFVNIGDVNGDGIADFAVGLIGAYNNDGLVTILYGGNKLITELDICTFTDKAVGFRMIGASGNEEQFGSWVTSMGDLNGDGIPDIAVAAQGWSNSNYDGKVYIIYLPNPVSKFLEYTLPNLDYYSFTAPVGSGNYFGQMLASAGDVNGDGLQDVIVASDNNYAVVLYGKKSASGNTDITVMTTDQGHKLVGSNSDTNFGQSVTQCGDINGDGLPEILITSPTSNYLYIVYGTNSSTSSSSVTVSASNGNGFAISTGSGSLEDYQAPICVDIDADSKLDIIVVVDDTPYVIYGSAINTVTAIDSMTSSQGFEFKTSSSASLGQFLAPSGGYKKYGVRDLLFTDPDNSIAYLIYASSTTFGPNSGLTEFDLDTMSSSQGLKFTTTNTDDKVNTIFADTDVNDDGINDIQIGIQDTTLKVYRGYVVYGACASGNAQDCISCPTGCATCTGGSKGVCETCNSDYHLTNSFCCASGQIYDSESKACIAEKKHDLSGGQIAGIVLGCVGFVIVVGAVIFFLLKKNGIIKASSQNNPQPVPTSPSDIVESKF